MALPLQWKALVGAVITVPLFLFVLLQGRGKPADAIAVADNEVWLKTGMLTSNLDSLKIHPGDTLRLLAASGDTYWVETADGLNRGYVDASFAQTVVAELPKREKRSCYFISRGKFDELVADSALTFAKLESEYLPAEYIRRNGKGFVAEYGFTVIELNGDKSRPVITFTADSLIADSRLDLYRRSLDGPLSALQALEEIQEYSKEHGDTTAFTAAASNTWVDAVSPLISMGDAGWFNPFESAWSNLIWTYLVGFIPLFLFMLLLWARYPLKWMPNGVAKFIAYTLCILPPALWCLLLRVQGLSLWPMSIVTIVFVFIVTLFFMHWFSSLRCPRCKVLQYPEYIRQSRGEPFQKHIRYKTAINTVVVRSDVKEIIKTIHNDKTSTTHKYRTLQGYVDEEVTYEYGVRHETWRLVTHHYLCRHCGLGQEECIEELVGTVSEPYKTETKRELRRVDETEMIY